MEINMEKKFQLRDGTEFMIRPPTANDIDRSFAFFQELSPDDKAYLRVDVSKRVIVAERLRVTGLNNVRRLVALDGDKIIADGAIELRTHGWESHIAELRLLVASDFKGKGIGGKMAEELYLTASKEKVEEIVVKVMSPHKDSRAIFNKIGFKEDVILKDYVKDISGKKHDLVLMRCDLDGLWKEIEDYFHEGDVLEIH